MNGVFIQDRNLSVSVNASYLSYMAKISKYKAECRQYELDMYSNFMQVMRTLSKEHAELILLKYFKLAQYPKSQDKVYLKNPNVASVRNRYLGRGAKNKEVAKEMGISPVRVKKLEYQAFETIAKSLIELETKTHKLERKDKFSYHKGTIANTEHEIKRIELSGGIIDKVKRDVIIPEGILAEYPEGYQVIRIYYHTERWVLNRFDSKLKFISYENDCRVII